MRDNLGAFVTPFVVSSIQSALHTFRAGFAGVTFGMLTGLMVYFLSKNKFLHDAGKEIPNSLKKTEAKHFIFYFNVLGLGLDAFLGILVWMRGKFSIHTVILKVTILSDMGPVIYFIKMLSGKKHLPLNVRAFISSGCIILDDSRTRKHNTRYFCSETY